MQFQTDSESLIPEIYKGWLNNDARLAFTGVGGHISALEVSEDCSGVRFSAESGGVIIGFWMPNKGIVSVGELGTCKTLSKPLDGVLHCCRENQLVQLGEVVVKEGHGAVRHVPSVHRECNRSPFIQSPGHNELRALDGVWRDSSGYSAK